MIRLASLYDDLSASMPERTGSMKTRLANWRYRSIPARYDTSKNKQYNPQHNRALAPPKTELFVR